MSFLNEPARQLPRPLRVVVVVVSLGYSEIRDQLPHRNEQIHPGSDCELGFGSK